MTDFRSQLDTVYKIKVLGNLEIAMRAVALVVDSELVRTTPVDTGRARSNWIPTLNAPAAYTNVAENKEKKPKNYVPPRRDTAETVTANFKVSDKIYITNNLPYIQRLNDGWSTQAPAGFVEKAIDKGKRAIKRALKK